ncbi:MAG: aminopeptidase N C-terminal domain-containing protein, partial [Gammaproteobacteria bacterium]
APHTESQLHFLVRHDVDPYCRCEAGQQLLLQAVLNAVEQTLAARPVQFQATLAPTFATLLESPVTDPALVAEMLMLPGQSYIAEQLQSIQPLAIVAAYADLHRHMATALHEHWSNIISALTPVAAYEFTSMAAGQRRLHGLALTYLADADAGQLAEICKTQFARADNMTDSLAALTAINNVPGAARDELFAAFEQRWHDNPLVLDKWFRLQAIARRPNALEEVAALMQHPAFTLHNPNRVRALLGAFTVDNMAGLHRADGAGYAFIADRVLELDRLNGQVAARLASCLTRWRRYAEQHAEMMHAELERILAAGNLSTNLYEVVSKSLAED